MILTDLVEVCQKFMMYGDCVGEQIADAISLNVTRDNYNPNVTSYLREFLQLVVSIDPELAEDADEVLEYVARRQAEINAEDEEEEED